MFAIVGALAASVPPHIVHIMADDTGWNDLGYKNGLIDSPNLDRLAMEGIRLTRHHSFKVCSPSRSSFHTGRYAFSLGLYDNSPAAVPWLPAFNAQVCTHVALRPKSLLRRPQKRLSSDGGGYACAYQRTAWVAARASLLLCCTRAPLQPPFLSHSCSISRSRHFLAFAHMLHAGGSSRFHVAA